MNKIVSSAVAAVAVALFLAGCGDEGKVQGENEHKGHKQGAAAPADTTEIAQKTCPVMGGKINPKLFADHKGRRVYFCCKMCVEKFKKDPENYIKKVDAEIAGSKAGEPDNSGHEGHQH